eukprot:8852384-Lingulodinium_polyedra.AAC.1
MQEASPSPGAGGNQRWAVLVEAPRCRPPPRNCRLNSLGRRDAGWESMSGVCAAYTGVARVTPPQLDVA